MAISLTITQQILTLKSIFSIITPEADPGTLFHAKCYSLWSVPFFFYYLFQFCAKIALKTLHHYLNIKFAEQWNGLFLRIARNGLFLVIVNTGRSSILTKNWFFNFRHGTKKFGGTLFAPSHFNCQNDTKYDESYLSTVPNMLVQKYFCQIMRLKN